MINYNNKSLRDSDSLPTVWYYY